MNLHFYDTTDNDKIDKWIDGLFISRIYQNSENIYIYFFTRKILLENQQNSTHKKKRYIHIYTEKNKQHIINIK